MLAAWGLMLAAWSLRPLEAWGLKLLTIDQDPGAKLGPTITHDLELSSDGGRTGRSYGMVRHYC